ncbi:hypothetical protein EV424DRAFT_1349928 [Suillus variegatus]|nr:hypothetical protein EV424DRAFT_1349928 [Suillus variegatus]
MYFLIKAIFVTILMVVSICAQDAFINLPAPGSDITAGTNFTVQIGLPSMMSNHLHYQNDLTGSEEISIVIGIQSCPTGDCLPISEGMGTVLYEGPFNPQYGLGADDPYEDFSVQVPASFATGQAQLGLAHFTLIGSAVAHQNNHHTDWFMVFHIVKLHSSRQEYWIDPSMKFAARRVRGSEFASIAPEILFEDGKSWSSRTKLKRSYHVSDDRQATIFVAISKDFRSSTQKVE